MNETLENYLCNPLIEFIINSIDYPIFIKNTKGQFLLVNKVFKVEVDLPTNHIIGKTIFEIVDDHDYAQRVFEHEQKFLQSEKLSIINTEYIKHRSQEGSIEMFKKKIIGMQGETIGIFGILFPFQGLIDGEHNHRPTTFNKMQENFNNLQIAFKQQREIIGLVEKKLEKVEAENSNLKVSIENLKLKVPKVQYQIGDELT